MAKYSCPFATREYGKPTLSCKLGTQQFNLCGHQFYCHNSGQYELSDGAPGCRLAKSNQNKTNPKGI